MPRLPLRLFSSSELRERLERALRGNPVLTTTGGWDAEDVDPPHRDDRNDFQGSDPDPSSGRANGG